MRALALDFVERRVAERDAGEPVLSGEDEVLFRVLEVGICGTDRALSRFEFGRPPAGDSHLILGHEALGEVLAVGQNVEGLRPGDLVAPMIRRACGGPCRFCAKGRRDGCETGSYTERGIFGAHGYFTDLAVDRAEDLVRVPESLRSVAVLLEPLSVVEKAVRLAIDTYEETPRSALVLGAGPIGVLTALALLARGIPVVVHSLEAADHPRARQVLEAGAGYLQSDPPSADLVFEAAGAASAGYLAVEKLAPAGVAVILGATNAVGRFPFHDLIVGNRKVLGVVNAGPRAFRAAVEDLERIGVRPLGRLIDRAGRGDWQRTFSRGGDALKFVHQIHS